MPSRPERDPHLFQPDDMSPVEVAELLGRARALQGHVGAAEHALPLRGKYLALLCDSEDSEGAIAFRRAATELGARVATIRPNLTADSTPNEIEHTARMLGRLYEAVECQGMAETLVSAIARNAGIPVYDGLATDRHAIAGLAPLLGIEATPVRRRALLVQAALLGSIA